MIENKEKIDAIISKFAGKKGTMIPLLQEVQHLEGYLPKDVISYVAKETRMRVADIYGVATFYSMFRLKPQGEHVIRVCKGTACHVSGANSILDAVKNELKLTGDEDTTEDGKFTVMEVACLGCCSLAPVIMIDEDTHGKLTPDSTRKVLKSINREEKLSNLKIKVGMASCGTAAGATEVWNAIEEYIERTKEDITLEKTACIGMCYAEPLVELYTDKEDAIIYGEVTPEKIENLIKSYQAGTPVNENVVLANSDVEQVNNIEKQTRIVLRNCGIINPECIDDYLANDGYKALEKALKTMSREDVIEEMKKSGLRGRGGAGFSTGMKWQFAYNSQNDKKYVVCNADEGDPGAFMDRSALEGDPHSVIEGMAICAYAIGADEGYLYVRAEYPMAIRHLQKALKDAEEKGYLGKNVLGTDFNFELHIKEGAGAFVCGEETALMASIEGERGMPRIRPPFPAQSGLWKYPTNINNVETYANVAWIVLNGAEKYASYGTEKSPGTKVFALAGKIAKSGLIEVPMGMPLREVIYDVGGGMKDEHPFKAVQLGGPSGGCVPADLLDTTVDYDSIIKTGAIMGSGGMVVMDTTTCMVDVAKFFLNFTQNESCGKCTFCRIGTKRMLEILNRITEGKGKMEDIDTLDTLAKKIIQNSLCGLGQSAPNPVLTTIKYFRHEYEAHIKDHKCPAGVCTELIKFEVVEDKCIGCTLCAKNCPVDAIEGSVKQPHVIDQEKCIKCGVCLDKCPVNAITKE